MYNLAAIKKFEVSKIESFLEIKDNKKLKRLLMAFDCIDMQGKNIVSKVSLLIRNDFSN